MYSPQQKAQWQNNRRLDTSAVIARLHPDVKPHAYIVGSWVWISFSHKPSSDVLNELKSLGFNWNKKRRVWQHPCGLFRPEAPYDPRQKYGVTRIETEESPE